MASRPGLQRQHTVAAKKVIILVSGANSGIGFELVKKIALEHPNTHHVLLGCRETSEGEAAVSAMGAPPNVNPIQLDATDDDSIDLCYKTIDQIFGKLDILVNNAGTAGTSFPEGTSLRDQYKQIYDVNCVSVGCLTERMIPLLSKSQLPKIIFTTSRMGSITRTVKQEVEFADIPQYNSSKAALNYLCAFYSRKYPDWKVNAFCPGHRATGLNTLEESQDSDPAKGVIPALRLILDGREGKTGTFTEEAGTVPW